MYNLKLPPKNSIKKEVIVLVVVRLKMLLYTATRIFYTSIDG